MNIPNFIKTYFEYLSSHRILLLCICIFSFLSLIDIPSSPVFLMPPVCQYLYLATVSVFKGLLLMTLMYPLLRMRLTGVVWVAVGLFGVISMFNAFSFFYYGMGISRKLMLIMAQTTPDETRNFLPGLLGNIGMMLSSLTLYIAAVIVILLYFIVKKCGRKTFIVSLTVMAMIGMGSFVAFSIAYTSGRSAHFMVARIAKYGIEVYDWNKQFQAMQSDCRPLPDSETVTSDHLSHTVVIVIGESALRSHHSAYGYPLQTTPSLDSMADSLTLFTDAIGSSKSTAGNMERILSFKEDDATFGDGLEYPLVIDFLKEAGYKTYWLSNQERMGTVSNTSGVMVMNSDVIVYAGADNSEDALIVKYDDVLLPYFDNAIADSAEYKFIFLHLLGSHVEYNRRYPKDYGYFNADDELNAFDYKWLDRDKATRRAEYDNSIRYTDRLLSHIIQSTAALDEPALFIYFSDHGENVYDDSSYSGRDNSTVRVPFVVYANKRYRDENPDIIRQINDRSGRSFSTANIVHMLITLTGSGYIRYNPRLDVLSDDFIERARYVDERIWKYDKAR